MKLRNIFLCAAALVVALSCGSTKKSALYSWEEGRTKMPSFAAMSLCYGGSAHRNPYLWTKDRFAPMVSCLDSEGKEQWLFDSFLAIEFVENGLSMGFGHYAESSDKAAWQTLIDYWFTKDNGFDALDKAIGEVIERIGAPENKRTVVMNLPDPIMYKMFNDSTTTSIYWGELDGRQMDFRKGEDRIAAMKWYIDQVRERFNAAKYQNIELIGFYLISEDLAIPGDGYSAELKHYEDIFPAVCDYLHSVNEYVFWIPYYAAAPYSQWKSLGIDATVMQPNYFWLQHSFFSWDDFEKMLKDYDMGMELEFDVKMEGSSPQALEFKNRLRTYLKFAKERGIYGTKSFALYSDTDAFYDMAHSDDPTDKEIFREFCDFILNNPLRLK